MPSSATGSTRSCPPTPTSSAPGACTSRCCASPTGGTTSGALVNSWCGCIEWALWINRRRAHDDASPYDHTPTTPKHQNTNTTQRYLKQRVCLKAGPDRHLPGLGAPPRGDGRKVSHVAKCLSIVIHAWWMVDGRAVRIGIASHTHVNQQLMDFIPTLTARNKTTPKN